MSRKARSLSIADTEGTHPTKLTEKGVAIDPTCINVGKLERTKPT